MEQIKKICMPLENIGITIFSYIKNFRDGSQVYLSNRSDWINYYYENQLYESSLFEGHPDLYNSGHIIWPSNNNRKVFTDAREKFDSGDGIVFVEKHEKYCEFFFFSGSVNNKVLANFIVNNVDLLKRFILYFKDKADKLIRTTEEKRIIIPDHFHNLKVDEMEFDFIGYLIRKEKLLREDFIRATKINKYIYEDPRFGSIKLSAREIDCAFALLKGKTAEETANELCISRRTVEDYLETLRLKFNCNNKYELRNVLIRCGFKDVAW